MSAPATTNPWKRRKHSRLFPPSRAMLAELSDGSLATATWCLTRAGWICRYGDGFLKWMKGTDPKEAPLQLQKKGIKWHWIVPLYGKPLLPPF